MTTKRLAAAERVAAAALRAREATRLYEEIDDAEPYDGKAAHHAALAEGAASRELDAALDAWVAMGNQEETQ